MSHVEGLENIIANLQKAVDTETAKMNSRLDLAGDYLHEAVKKKTGYTDHPQWELNMLGNPYSTRYETDYSIPHGDDSITHIQSGILHRNIEKVTDFGSLKSSVAVGVDINKVGDYIKEVIEGTTKVRPRPFLQRAFSESKDKIKAILEGGSS